MTTTRKVFAVVAVIALLPIYSSAQFLGIGPTITFDPTVAAKIVTETLKVAGILTSLEKQYAILTADREILRNRSLLRGWFAQLSLNQLTSNQSGVTGGWQGAVNGSIKEFDRWNEMAMEATYNPRLLASDEWYRKMSGNAEIRTGATQTGILALGNARQTQQQMAKSIQECEDRSLSLDPADNTARAVANINNTCTNLILRQSQTQLALQTSQLEEQLAAAKQSADTQNANLTMWGNAAAWRDSGATSTTFDAQALQNYRLP